MLLDLSPNGTTHPLWNRHGWTVCSGPVSGPNLRGAFEGIIYQSNARALPPNLPDLIQQLEPTWFVLISRQLSLLGGPSTLFPGYYIQRQSLHQRNLYFASKSLRIQLIDKVEKLPLAIKNAAPTSRLQVVCACGCGMPIEDKRSDTKTATSACRKRVERRKKGQFVTV